MFFLVSFNFLFSFFKFVGVYSNLVRIAYFYILKRELAARWEGLVIVDLEAYIVYFPFLIFSFYSVYIFCGW